MNLAAQEYSIRVPVAQARRDNLKAALFGSEGRPTRGWLPLMISGTNEYLRRDDLVGHRNQVGWELIASVIARPQPRRTADGHEVIAAADKSDALLCAVERKSGDGNASDEHSHSDNNGTSAHERPSQYGFG